MPFTRPTLTELIDRVSTDIASRLPGVSTTLLRRSLAGILARAEAGAVHSLYGYLDFIARQAIPDTAEDEYLLRWAAIWLPAGRKGATFASGTDAVQVTGTIGAIMPAGTVVVRSDGLQFQTTADLTLAASTGLVSVDALAPGSGSNTEAGISLSLLVPVTGFQSSAIVVSPGISGGVNIESLDALRSRLISRIQQPPQGGSEADYETWALEVPGVTRAWVYPLTPDLGQVTVIIANDEGGTAPIPDAPTVAAALAYIEEKRPVTAEVFVLPPTVLIVDMDVSLNPNTAATQAAALAELEDLFLREAEPGGVIYLSKMWEAVSISAGVMDSAITDPVANVTGATGQIPVLGTVTWSALP
jgi:uncharacterized phage protein gp47/JayE